MLVAQTKVVEVNMAELQAQLADLCAKLGEVEKSDEKTEE